MNERDVSQADGGGWVITGAGYGALLLAVFMPAFALLALAAAFMANRHGRVWHSAVIAAVALVLLFMGVLSAAYGLA